LREIVERLRPQLRSFRDERGRELFDLPDAPRTDPDVPAPPRFLPAFDNLILSYADRTRVVADEHRKWLTSRNGMVPATVLVGGFVRGIWKAELKRGKATLVIEPFEPLAKEDRDALANEGAGLLAFAAADVETRDIEFGVVR
jgi:Winged helix DNA-binding domain